jgi:hypothetical protein
MDVNEMSDIKFGGTSKMGKLEILCKFATIDNDNG